MNTKKAGRPKQTPRAILRELAVKLLDWIKQENNDFLADFCIQNNITEKDIKLKAKKCPELKQAVDLALQKERQMLIKTGSNQRQSISIFLLKAKHGYKETSTIENKVKLPEIKVIITKNKK